MTNLILNTDSYKTSHFLQYPPETEKISSYIEARGVSRDFVPVEKTVFFGLQMFLEEYMSKPITKSNIEEAEDIFKMHGVPFNRQGWDYILNAHDGYLPVMIQALPEGYKVPLHTALVQVQNTDDRVPWLTSYVETALLRAVWYPTTVATLSRHIKDIIAEELILTQGNTEGIDFMLHDFGARGVSSKESAGIGGVAHLVNFQGTDTVEALVYARKYYKASMPAYSIPAAEHSTITAWGCDGEVKAYENMVDQFGDKLYAVVSDSYDIYNAADNLWGTVLKNKVIEKGGRLVIRPDSGNPVDVIGRLLHILADKFGYTTNERGFRVLHPSVRLIQGDGVNANSIKEILKSMRLNGWATSNIVFGMGGALLQQVNRDSLKFAMKASAIMINGKWQDVYKDPVTDPGKMSKRGLLEVVGDDFKTIRAEDRYLTSKYLKDEPRLNIVYRDGVLTKEVSLDTIRERSNM